MQKFVNTIIALIQRILTQQVQIKAAWVFLKSLFNKIADFWFSFADARIKSIGND